MSSESDKQERGRLQHAAEHERPNKPNSVVFYLLVLFVAAFLLLLMSFLMQQRANREAMDNLQQTSDSAVESLDNMLEENETLKQENETLRQQVDQLQEELEAATPDTTAGDTLEQQLAALNYLNQVRALYNAGRYTEARDAIAGAEAAMAAQGGMEAVLGTVSEGLTEEQRSVYDPLTAYQSLTQWLS